MSPKNMAAPSTRGLPTLRGEGAVRSRSCCSTTRWSGSSIGCLELEAEIHRLPGRAADRATNLAGCRRLYSFRAQEAARPSGAPSPIDSPTSAQLTSLAGPASAMFQPTRPSTLSPRSIGGCSSAFRMSRATSSLSRWVGSSLSGWRWIIPSASRALCSSPHRAVSTWHGSAPPTGAPNISSPSRERRIGSSTTEPISAAGWTRSRRERSSSGARQIR
jgi:hypothetical protein